MSSFIHDFDRPPSVAPDDLSRLLGGKGANLSIMATELGLPVPPAFTISTDACREFLERGWPDGLDDELRQHMDRLGELVGRRFGDAEDPLLVSVRSGAPVSMPGMMDTVLNLGLTADSARGLAAVTGDERFAADCLRRLGDGYLDVIGLVEVPDDPWVQLRAAIEAVFRSWNSDRARAYRRHEGIPDDLGTAVTVQAMVFGNRGADSGTGVLFTRNPSTGEPELYGDIMFDAQGEDVVAGGHEPRPLATLGERLPEVAAELRRHADLLERHYADLCDIEFTIEQGRLWLLQVRVGKRSPRAALRMAIDMASDPSFPLDREAAVRRVLPQLADPPRTFVAAGEMPEPVARGLPASPGVASGEIVTTSDGAESAAAAGRSVILVRAETSPEDVAGMARSAGVLTSLGGLASHAAVVARGWGIPAVVGAAEVRPSEEAVEIGERRFAIGDEITIDGGTGAVYPGRQAGEWSIVEEAATLLGWAAELGIEIPSEEPVPADNSAPVAAPSEEATAEDVTRALLIRGGVGVPELAGCLLADASQVEALVARLVEDGTVERADAGLRLSAQGRLGALALFEADRAAIGGEACLRYLDEFHAFDQRVKQIVTAWQIREADGEQALNDHTDAAYDAAVIGDLGALHADMAGWLAPLASRLRRIGVYRTRLERAVARARDGEQPYVASPRVDSYHTVWFELHEDLIRLAGKRRADEAAAGRA